MANVLPRDKQVTAIHALCEGSSIRSVERMTGVHRDTVMRLGVRVGEACARMHDEVMRDLRCTQIQADEVWGFVGKKERKTTVEDRCEGLGDVWTFVAFDPETKLVPSYVVGKRDFLHTSRFVDDLSGRMRSRIQLSTDGWRDYACNVENTFGSGIDYGQIVKVYGRAEEEPKDAARRYSPPRITAVNKRPMIGEPDIDGISTSLVERQNLTMRMHVRRLTRLTNAFSKKFENFRAAVALHFAYYNFVRVHGTLGTTPAEAAGVARGALTVGELIDLA